MAILARLINIFAALTFTWAVGLGGLFVFQHLKEMPSSDDTIAFLVFISPAVSPFILNYLFFGKVRFWNKQEAGG